MGRKAQRQVIVRAMQKAVTENQKIREETMAFTLIAAPGYPELIDEMLTLNVDRKETAFVICDSPLRLAPDAQGWVDWVTGVNAGTNGEDGIVTKSSEAAVYYPSVLTTDLNGYDVVAPASYAVLRTYAYNDSISYPWFAPAGLTRGVITNASNVGYVNSEGEFIPVALTGGQRDTLYANRINPMANFPGQGLYIWGQKTLYPTNSALDRVNVGRLLAYLRERFEVIARPFIFEPNDNATRANVKTLFDGFLGDIMQKRGIYDFLVVCDTTNNTPSRIDANELWIDIAIEPTKAAEFIYIPVRIVNTGALQ
jgi:phage tail sheath protein FI